MKDYWLLWDRFRDRYPEPEFKGPIGEIEIKLSNPPDLNQLPVRVWYLDSSKSQLLQVQNNLFLRNWRKTAEAPQYQHYADCSVEYRSDWSTFLDFLGGRSLPRPQIQRCEVSYFNHLIRGEDWEDFSELSTVYPAWHGPRPDYPLSNPKMINIGASYALQHGMLQINSQGAVRQSDGKEIIQLGVTAAVVPQGQSDSELFEALDHSHEAAVQGFLQFTSEEMHRRWRRTK